MHKGDDDDNNNNNNNNEIIIVFLTYYNITKQFVTLTTAKERETRETSI